MHPLRSLVPWQTCAHCRIVAEAAEGSEANAKIKELAKKVCMGSD